MSSDKAEDNHENDAEEDKNFQKNQMKTSNNTSKENKENITVDCLSKQIDNLCLNNEKHSHSKIKNIVTIPEWLKDCESPFSWHLEQERGLGPEHVILRTSEKLDELLIEEPEFSLQRFVSLFKLILEYFIIGNIDKSRENMRIIEGCLEEEISMKDPFYQKLKLSLGHVVSATKAHLLFIDGKEDESMKIGCCIIPMKIMTASNKAALYAMKGSFFLYSGYEKGEEVGIAYAKKALELEPENGEWEFLLAKILRQQRKEVPFSLNIPRDEMKLLESAVERDKNPKFIVYLAQVYRECSAQAFRQYRNEPGFFNSDLHKTLEDMTKKALDYYKQALSICPDRPAILRRVGYGIMNLPKKVADYDLALKCLLESLEISENQMTLHVLGTYYSRYANDNKKALEYYERTAKTGSVVGLMDMIRVKWILDQTYDPLTDFEVGLSWKLKKNLHNQLLAQLGGYYLFVKRDLGKAVEYFYQIVSEDKESAHMKNYKSFFLRMNEPIDLFRYLTNEALLVLQKQDRNSALEPETTDEEEAATSPISPMNLRSIDDFLDVISESYPHLMEITPDPTLVPKLIQASKDLETNWGSNRGLRGRRNFRSGQRGNYSGSRGGRGARQDSHESRGRFNRENKTEIRPNEGERRGGFYRERGQNRNWRQRSRDDSQRGEKEQKEENWRRK